MTARCAGRDGVGWSFCRVPRESPGAPTQLHALALAPEATGWVHSSDITKAEVYVCKHAPSGGTLPYLKAQTDAGGSEKFVQEDTPADTRVRAGQLVLGVEVRRLGDVDTAYLRLAATSICKRGELFLALCSDGCVWLEEAQRQQVSLRDAVLTPVQTPDMFPHVASVSMSLSLIKNLHPLAPNMVTDVFSSLLTTVKQIQPANSFRQASNAPLVIVVTNQILEFVLKHMLGAGSSYSAACRVAGIELGLALCVSTGDSVNMLRLLVLHLRTFCGNDLVDDNGHQHFELKGLDDLLENLPADPDIAVSPSTTKANASSSKNEDAPATHVNLFNKANALLRVVRAHKVSGLPEPAPPPPLVFCWGDHSSCIVATGGQVQVVDEDDGEGDYHIVLSKDSYSSGTHRFEMTFLDPSVICVGFMDRTMDITLEDDNQMLQELEDGVIYFHYGHECVYNMLPQGSDRGEHEVRLPRRGQALSVELNFASNRICFYRGDTLMYKWESSTMRSRAYRLVVCLDYEGEGAVLTKYQACVLISIYPCCNVLIFLLACIFATMWSARRDLPPHIHSVGRWRGGSHRRRTSV